MKKIFEWFFCYGDPRFAAILRVAFSLLFSFFLWDLYPDLQLLLSPDGVLGRPPKSEGQFKYILNLLSYRSITNGAEIWFWSSSVACALLFVGLFTRVMTPLLVFSLILFQQTCPPCIHGGDLALLNLSFWLIFLRSGQVWSLDHYLFKKSHATIEHWPIKAIQIQVALIYLNSGLCKIGTIEWKTGVAVYDSLQLQFLSTGLLPEIRQSKIFSVIVNYYTLCVELLFPIFVFRKTTRLIALFSVVFMHIGIDLLMHIRFFSTVMYFGLLSFLQPEDFRFANIQFNRLPIKKLFKNEYKFKNI